MKKRIVKQQKDEVIAGYIGIFLIFISVIQLFIYFTAP